MKQIILLFIVSLVFNLSKINAQTQTKELNLDSLVKANERYVKQDLTKLKLLNALTFSYPNVDPAKGIETGQQTIELAQKLHPDKSGQLLLAEAYNNKGLNHVAKSEYPTAMDLIEKALAMNQSLKNTFGIAHNTFNIGDIFRRKKDNKKAKELFEQALSLFEGIPDKAGIAKCYNGLGAVYKNLSDYPKALEYYQKSLAIFEQMGNKRGMANCLTNIGLIYDNLSDYPKTLEYYQRALVLNEQMGNKSNMAANLDNIGRVYNSLSDQTKALEYFQKALTINEQIGNKGGLANNLVNIGIAYYNLSDHPKALEYYQKALAIEEQIGNKRGMSNNLGNIGIVYYNLSDYPKALEYYLKAQAIDEQMGNKNGMAANLSNIGNVYSDLSDHPKALENYQKALAIYEQMGHKYGMAAILGNIGIVYSDLSDHPKALENYQKALVIYEQIGNKRGMATNLSSIGIVCKKLSNSDCAKLGISASDKYSKALEYFQKALAIDEQMGNKSGMANNLGNIGTVYRDAPDSVLVKMNINTSERNAKALEYHNRSLNMAQEIGELRLQEKVWNNLSLTYEMQGNYAKAHDAYKKYIVLRDSIESDEIKNKIERKTMQFEFDKKETALRFDQQLTKEKLIQSQQEAALGKQALLITKKEKDLQHLDYLKTQAELHQQKIVGEKQVALNGKKDAELQLLGKASELKQTELNLSKAEVKSKNQQRNAFMVGFAVVLLFAGVFFRQRNKIGKEKKISDKERKRSDELLLNILPSEVAEELKAKGSADAQLMDEVTVLFTDFKGFTQLSEKLSPKELVAEINECFSAFDNIMQKHGVEKIKTIGDAYMAAGGLPTANTTHANDVVLAALDIQQFMHEHKAMKEAAGQLFFEIRIGVHTGPVVAGIVGIKKFAYDIWGDTVNTASRMESSGEVGKVNISETTYELVKDKFNCEHRGKITAKGKGEIDMYFVGNKNLD